MHLSQKYLFVYKLYKKNHIKVSIGFMRMDIPKVKKALPFLSSLLLF